MSDFIRPELRRVLWRWREALAGLALLALGLWWFGTFVRPVNWIGGAILLLGAAALVGGIQKARFRAGGTGPGVVQIDERRVTYFGPLTGGALDLDDLTRLELEPNAHPAPHWIMTGIGGQNLAIPVNATGADALFELFATLQGLQTTALVRHMQNTPEKRVTVWDRPPVRLS